MLLLKLGQSGRFSLIHNVICTTSRAFQLVGTAIVDDIPTVESMFKAYTSPNRMNHVVVRGRKKKSTPMTSCLVRKEGVQGCEAILPHIVLQAPTKTATLCHC